MINLIKMIILTTINLIKLSSLVNPLLPSVKIRNLTLNRLLTAEFVKKMVYLGAHYK